MTPGETLDLFKQGREAWNAWAQGMLDERQALIEAGKWEEGRPTVNTETSQWHARAMANFRGHRFADRADFVGFIFPAESRFDNAIFKGQAFFIEAEFKGVALFDNTAFNSVAWFSDAVFEGGASFSHRVFENRAEFIHAEFKGMVLFDRAVFENRAGFPNAEFNRYTSFADTRFRNTAEFVAIRGQRAFTFVDATFAQLPDFEQAHFDEAPRLDNLRIEPRPFRSAILARLKRPFRTARAVAGFDAVRERPARWRSLKRLAVRRALPLPGFATGETLKPIYACL